MSDCPIHGNQWCTCKSEVDPSSEQIKAISDDILLRHSNECAVHSPKLKPCSCGFETRMRSELSRLRASLAAVTKERDEARVKADMGEQVRLDLKAWYARLKGVPVESVSDMHGLDLTMVIAALVESRLAIAAQAERERCTKIADEMAKSYDASWRELREKKNLADARECSHKATACEIIAAAIRSGKEVGT